MQVKENEQKKAEIKSYIKEQGDIWKNEDDTVLRQLKEKKALKKKKQIEIKETLDRQIREKEEKILNDLQFSPAESRINKSIYSSAIKILGEDN